MSGLSTNGSGWTLDLPFSPKKQKAYEDKLGSSRPVRYDHRISEILQPKTMAQPRVIADSDEEDDDDDDFPDLLVSANAPPSKPAKTTLTFPSSQSSDQPSPKKVFEDFMAIINDAEEADEIDKLQQSAASVDVDSPSRERSDKLQGRALFEEAVNIVKNEADEDDSDTDQHLLRVRQALDRQAAAHSTPYYYFFGPVKDESSAPQTPSLVSNPSQRAADNALRINLAVESKLMTNFFPESGVNLPDELIVWILDVFPAEKSEAIREEYLQIMTTRPEQVGGLVNERRLKQLFLGIGADDGAISFGVQGKFVGEREASRGTRDWRPFYNVLELLRRCCDMFTFETQVHVAVFLLRASMDSEVRLQASLASTINDTLATLSSKSRSLEREKLCRKVCNLFVQTVDSVNLLSRAVEAMHHVRAELPSTDPTPEEFKPFEDLRTRLQLSAFFKDAERAGPEHCGTAAVLLRSILQRLDEPDFKSRVGGRGDINYYDLVGYGVILTEIIPFLHFLHQRHTDKAELSQLNIWVDDLRRKISYINSTVQIAGSMEDYDVRHEAKTCWQSLDWRIAHFFPRRGGTGVFDDGEAEEKARKEQRGQQNFMAGFLQKHRAPNAA